MTRVVARENSQAAEDKDPKAVRPDIVGKRQLAAHIVEDREDPAPVFELLQQSVEITARDMERQAARMRAVATTMAEREREARDQDRYLRNLTSTEGKNRGA